VAQAVHEADYCHVEILPRGAFDGPPGIEFGAAESAHEVISLRRNESRECYEGHHHQKR
jgi:hypothetical protein